MPWPQTGATNITPNRYITYINTLTFEKKIVLCPELIIFFIQSIPKFHDFNVHYSKIIEIDKYISKLRVKESDLSIKIRL